MHLSGRLRRRSGAFFLHATRLFLTLRGMKLASGLFGFFLLLIADPLLSGEPLRNNVRDYGAMGDGRTLDTLAIQRAIEAASGQEGGVVIIPKGSYISGQLRLPSRTTMILEEGAVLLASTNPVDYQAGARSGTLLVASGSENITLKGGGCIDGQAVGDLGKRWGAPEPGTLLFRTHLLAFDRCRNVLISNVNFVNSDSWTLHLKRCTNVIITGVSIHNNYRRLNSDGIDPDSCSGVRINHCDIVTGDDAVVLKTTVPEPCVDVTVTDCRLESATAALKLGTESLGDFRKIHFEHCTIRNSPVGIGLFVKDGALMEDIVAKDLTMEMNDGSTHFVAPLFIDIEKRNPGSKVGMVRNVAFEQIDITSGAGLLLQGMPESPLHGMTLRNVTLHVRNPLDYSDRKKPVGGRRTTRDERDTLYAQKPTYAALAYIKRLTVENLVVDLSMRDFQLYPRSALAGFHLQDASIGGVRRSADSSQNPVVELQDSSGASLQQ